MFAMSSFIKNTRLRHGLLVVLFFLLLVAGWLLWSYQRPVAAPSSFDHLVWKQPSADGSSDPACVRNAMALDLVDRNELPGKFAQQVTELLGVPDEQGAGFWIYHLGQCPGMGWNDSDLRLRLDAGMAQVQSATVEHVTVLERR
jgi:hypothetical protein